MQQLESDSRNFHSLLKNSPLAIFSLGLDGNVTFWNPACENLFGWKEQEVLGKPNPIAQPDKMAEFKSFFDGAILGKIFTDVEVVRQKKDGTLINLSFSTAPVYSHENMIEGYMAICFDISEKKQLEKVSLARKKELVLSKKRLRRLIQNSYDIIGISDENGKMIYQSPKFKKVTGYSLKSVIDQNAFDFIHPDDHRLVKKVYQDLLLEPKKTRSFQFRLKKADQTWVYCDAIGTNLLNDPSINGLLFNYWDITERKQYELKLHSIAYHDYLTEIGNRRLMEEALMSKVEKAAKESTTFAYMLIDLDEFKLINDTLGHEYGDLLLKEIALKLQQEFQHKGVIAKVGGDEFAILMHNVLEIEAIRAEAEKVIGLFQEPFFIEGLKINITASIGVCVYPYSGKTPKAIQKSADLAKYRAKELGRNQYVLYTPILDIGTYKAFTIHNDLRNAVTNKELTVFYQPRIDSHSTKIIGAEALVRWNHPKWGMVSPGEFISMAEKSGIIVSIGKWVVDHVCKQINEWKRMGLPQINVSINFSPLQFTQPDLVDSIKTTIEQYQVDPKNLEIEITESAVLDHEEETLKKIKKLKEFGIQIAIDDFGTGYSSLLYLKKFKVDTIKIDQSFVKDLDKDGDSDNSNIVSALIQLAKNLNINVVAEGVETNQQSALLKQMDCDELQGYLFSKPVPPEEFVKILKTGNWKTEKTEVRPLVNRRRFFRVHLPNPLEADTTLVKIGGRKVKLGTTHVLVENIGPDGLCFSSNVHIPVKPDIKLMFRTTIFDKEYDLFGRMVWGKELNNGIHQYGIQFEIEEESRTLLIASLNQIQARLRHSPICTDCRMVQTDKNTYFKK